MKTDPSQLLHAFSSAPDLQRLELLLGEFNIFEAIGVRHQENRHSDFLAFLLSPHQSHGLGDEFLKAILRRAGYKGQKLSEDLSKTQVSRESNNIDIIAVNHSKELVVVIENKIYSGEHSDQLTRYREDAQSRYPSYDIECLYLTPKGAAPSHSDFRAISYATVAQEIERLAALDTLPADAIVRATMTHYVRMLRRHILGDEETARLCMEIYRQHKQAIDKIVQYVPNQRAQLHEMVVRLTEQTERMILIDTYKVQYARFIPDSWIELVPKVPVDKWTKVGYGLYFLFVVEPRRIELILQVRFGTPDEQRRLIKIAEENPRLLKVSNRTPDYITLYSKYILTEESFENAPFDDLLEDVDEWWADFVQRDLPAIEAIFLKELQL